jgi:hypothetical protein
MGVRVVVNVENIKSKEFTEIKTTNKELNMIDWDENNSFDILKSCNKIRRN